MSKLILIRHGETNTNALGKLHVSDDDESLNSVGRAQMENLST